MDKYSGSEEEEISMPISTNLATISDSSRLKMLTSSALADAEEEESKKKVKYRECLKNHAANMGGHVTDGCGEFMPGGGEGTPEALRCAACDCHRNFHRREVEGQATPPCCHRGAAAVAAPANVLTLPFARPQMLMAFNKGGGVVEAEVEREGSFLSSHGNVAVRKRFRTRFSPEQKERLLGFAQKLGWRIQKHDEAAVQNFCQEIGVKRHVLKVWMHNNKHTMASKSDNTATTDTANNNTSTSTTTTTANANAINNNGNNNLFK
ncbi:zinc-finger homeodomain protein 2 [Cryptomeria japonica]|uniref:zinc-finger homeodomain protein 2 n=1 Tax=Cryptomeria japonica TaxID=3369 RepID=UPI0025AD5756|nr:zinc-finger homeodomain protein 2 [Cryptomeria japonica]